MKIELKKKEDITGTTFQIHIDGHYEVCFQTEEAATEKFLQLKERVAANIYPIVTVLDTFCNDVEVTA